MARTPVYHEEKKAQIIRAALEAFSRYGFEGTTNKLIAQEAGKLIGQGGKPISPGLIYHYFPEGKAQLFSACLEQFPPLQRFSQIMRDNQDKPPEVFIRLVAETYNQVLKTEDVLPIIRLVVTEGPRQPEIIPALMKQLVPNLFQPMLAYMQKQIDSGKAKVQKPDQITMQIFGPIIVRRIMFATFGSVSGSFIKEKMLVSSDEEFIDNLVKSILAGLFS